MVRLRQNMDIHNCLNASIMAANTSHPLLVIFLWEIGQFFTSAVFKCYFVYLRLTQT